MSYFSKFPLMSYDIKGNKVRKLLPDILRRVKLRASIKSGGMLFDKYDVKEGEKPEDVAFKWFGDPELHPDAIHHYEVTKDSGRTTSQGPSDYSHKVEVNSDTDNAVSVSFREYEEREQDKKRQIQLLNKSLLGDFVAEFDRLIAE